MSKPKGPLTLRVINQFAEAFALYVYEMECLDGSPHMATVGNQGMDLVFAEESPMYAALMTELERQEGVSCIDPDKENDLCNFLHSMMYDAYRGLVLRGEPER